MVGSHSRMPSKKSNGQSSQQQQHVARPPSPILVEGTDPVQALIGVVEKKGRNLEKRRARLITMEESKREGKELTKDQLVAIEKLPEVNIQVDIVKEFQKQFAQLQGEIEKQKKKKEKQEKQHQKVTERETIRSHIQYSFRIQYILSNLGEAAKECFRSGSVGEVLTEAQLTQIDDLYHLLNPTRPGNPRYEKELEEASEHLMLLYEGSTKEVANTSYQALHDVLEVIESSGYFDESHEDVEEEEEDEEEEEEEEEEDEDEEEQGMSYPSNEREMEMTSPAAIIEQNQLAVQQEPLPPAPTPSTSLTTTQQQMQYIAPPTTQTVPTSYSSVSSRPPDFAGLAAEALQPSTQTFVSFMHDSAIDHVDPQSGYTPDHQEQPAVPPPVDQQELAPASRGEPQLRTLSPVENGHQDAGTDPERTEMRGDKSQPARETENRGGGGGGGYGGKYYGGGYSRGQRGRGPQRGGYNNSRDREYYRDGDRGGSRGWSGGSGGRYGGNNYGSRRGGGGGGRPNYRSTGYSQNRTTKQ